jgi:NarL family two-component system response regulator LiaR
MNEKQIKVLITDDQAIVRKGIRALLATEPDITVVGEAENGAEAINQTEKLQPDVILMDLVMPEMDGIEAISGITARHPEARILVLTSFATDDKVFPAIKAGALGYLLKDSSPEELVQAIHQVYQGEPSLHPTIARKVLQELQTPPEPEQTPTSEPLTEREVEVLQLIVRGLGNQQIADRLAISEATVRTHVSNILSKLHLASRTQAALYALQQGWASLDDAG